MSLTNYEVVFIDERTNYWYVTEDIPTETEIATNTYTSYKDTRLRLREVINGIINEVNNYGSKEV